MGQSLQWGRHYLMVEPDHFRVDYAINPYMDVALQPDPVRVREQWDALVASLRAAGAEVEVLAQRADSPDMVYAMNLGLVLDDRVVVSHMRYAERRREADSAVPWFAGQGLAPSYVGRDGVGAHLEAGDAFAFGDALVVGYGPRTEELALKHLATELDVRVRGLRITHPGMYHLDLAFCPLDADAGDGLPGRLRRGLGGGGAGAGPGPAGAERGGGADLLRQLRRGRAHRGDAAPARTGVREPGSRPGASRWSWSRSASSTSAAGPCAA